MVLACIFHLMRADLKTLLEKKNTSKIKRPHGQFVLSSMSAMKSSKGGDSSPSIWRGGAVYVTNQIKLSLLH